MASLSLYDSSTAATTYEQQEQQQQQQQQQHRSSSAFIAHLLVQEYPPKVQPRSSSARDKALFSHLDKVDAEAGCILIALANHDKRKDMNDLIPYSIRVIDYNQTKTMGITNDSSLETMETTTGESTSSISSSSCSDSSISDGVIRDAENDDPKTTSTIDECDSNRTMSIKNLVYGNNESSSSDTPALSENTKSSQPNGQQPSLSPSTSSTSLSSPLALASLNTLQNDDNDQSKTKFSSKPEPRTDPILLLAAAAKAIDEDDQRANQKRKYSNDDSGLESRSHSARRRRYTMDRPTSLDQSTQSEKSKFSHQYLSMKQNPKIMRNAMHAYISYMIYADLTSSDKMPHHQDQGITPTATLYPTHSSSPNSNYATSHNHRSFSVSSPPPPPPPSASASASSSSFNHHHHPLQSHSHYDHSSSRTNDPTPSTNSSSLNLGPSNNSIAGNSSIMARPLTAFLRDNMYT